MRRRSIPVIEPAFLNGVGPRVETHGLNLIQSVAYSAPCEDLKLKSSAKCPAYAAGSFMLYYAILVKPMPKTRG